MADACPVPTPEQRQVSKILDEVQRAMLEKVDAAVAEAAAQVREQVGAAGLAIAPASKEYLQAVVHQRMYLALCGADTRTYEGGDAWNAVGLIRNQQSLANRYWGAAIELTPKAG